jgi:hypothetical protein
MGVLGKIKGWFFGKHEGKESMPPKQSPKHEPRQTVVYEEEDDASPPEIDEYVEVELTMPAKKGQGNDYGKMPMEGTTMVKKKTTRKKTTKRKPAKKKATKKKTAKRKTAKKTMKKKATKKKTAKRKPAKKKKARKK